jgi:hypothetical protein
MQIKISSGEVYFSRIREVCELISEEKFNVWSDFV